MLFAYQCGVLALIRLLLGRDKSGHPHLLGILPDFLTLVSLSHIYIDSSKPLGVVQSLYFSSNLPLSGTY